MTMIFVQTSLPHTISDITNIHPKFNYIYSGTYFEIYFG